MNEREHGLNKDLAITYVPMEKCTPNAWNPNVQSDFILKKTKVSLLTFNFVDAILVREIDDPQMPFEIINGEHRWMIAMDIYQKTEQQGDDYIYIWEEEGVSKRYVINEQWAKGFIPVINIGKVDDNKAKELTIVLNSTTGEPDTVKLSTLIAELDANVGRDEITELLPYGDSQIQAYIDLLNYQEDAFNPDPPSDDNGSSDEEWTVFVCAIPPDAVDIIQSEFERIGELIEKKATFGDTPDKLKRAGNGLILEKIAVLSAQTPTGSIE